MGYALTWLAVRGIDEHGLFKAMGLYKTNRKTADFPQKSDLVGCVLENGWYLVISGECEDSLLSGNKSLAKLTANCEAIVCSIEEHVMFSECARWLNGRKSWAVSHSGEEGDTHIKKIGRPPQSYEEHKRALLAKQQEEGGGGTDYVFDLPVILAEEIVGFRHDAMSSSYNGQFDVLRLHPWQRYKRAISSPELIIKLIFFPFLAVALLISPFVQLIVYLRRLLRHVTPNKH